MKVKLEISIRGSSRCTITINCYIRTNNNGEELNLEKGSMFIRAKVEVDEQGQENTPALEATGKFYDKQLLKV